MRRVPHSGTTGIVAPVPATVRVHWRMKTFGRLLVETSDLPEEEKARRISDIEENGLGPAVMAILRMTDNLTKPLSERRVSPSSKR